MFKIVAVELGNWCDDSIFTEICIVDVSDGMPDSEILKIAREGIKFDLDWAYISLIRILRPDQINNLGMTETSYNNIEKYFKKNY